MKLGEADGSPPIRLESFRVEKLFGEFDHTIPLSKDSRVTALIAPNGTGKTACLRLINALFRRQWSALTSTEFFKLEYLFSDGTIVEVKRSTSDDLLEEQGSGIQIETRSPGAAADV